MRDYTKPADPKLPFGSRRCLCTRCQRYFSSPGTFDAHWTDGGCVDPATITTSYRMVERDGVWGWPTPDASTFGRKEVAA